MGVKFKMGLDRLEKILICIGTSLAIFGSVNIIYNAGKSYGMSLQRYVDVQKVSFLSDNVRPMDYAHYDPDYTKGMDEKLRKKLDELAEAKKEALIDATNYLVVDGKNDEKYLEDAEYVLSK